MMHPMGMRWVSWDLIETNNAKPSHHTIATLTQIITT
jgi:hypothetical protein